MKMAGGAREGSSTVVQGGRRRRHEEAELRGGARTKTTAGMRGEPTSAWRTVMTIDKAEAGAGAEEGLLHFLPL